MKVNEELLLKTFASCYAQNNSISESIESLYRFKMIDSKQYNDLVALLKKTASIKELLIYLKLNKTFIEYTLFYNNYYSLHQSIEKAITIIKERSAIKKDVASSLIYPIILIILTSVALLFVSSYIVPQLVLLNPDAKGEYNFIIVFLKYFPLVVFGSISIIIFIFLLVYYLLKNKFNDVIIQLTRIPIISNIITNIASLVLAMYLKEVIKSIPLSQDSITILKTQSNNIFVQYLCDEFLIGLKKGEHLFSIIEQSKLLKGDLKQTMYIAINSKNMSVLLKDYYDLKIEIIKKRIKAFLAIFIPIIVSIIGVVLILMYLLIMLPILSMGTNL